MEAVSVDLFQTAGKHYIVMVNRYSGFPFVHPLTWLDTNTITNCLTTWFMDWGIPTRLRSDRGPQFWGLFEEFCKNRQKSTMLIGTHSKKHFSNGETPPGQITYPLHNWWQDTANARCNQHTRLHTSISALDPHPLHKATPSPDGTSLPAIRSSSSVHTASAGTLPAKSSASTNKGDLIMLKQMKAGHTSEIPSSSNWSHLVAHQQPESKHGRWIVKGAVKGCPQRSWWNWQLLGLPLHRNAHPFYGHRDQLPHICNCPQRHCYNNIKKVLQELLGSGHTTCLAQHGTPTTTMATQPRANASSTTTTSAQTGLAIPCTASTTASTSHRNGHTRNASRKQEQQAKVQLGSLMYDTYITTSIDAICYNMIKYVW